MDIDNISGQINKKMLIGIAIIGIITFISVVGVIGAFQFGLIGGSDSEEQEDYGLYEYIPDDTNMIYQMDVISLADDQITRDILNDLGSEYEGDNWYNESYDEYISELNTELDDEDISSDIEDLNNIIVFSDINFNELNTESFDYNSESEIEEYNFGVLIKYEMTEDEFDNIMPQDDSYISTYEYDGYEIYVDEENDLYSTQLESETIVMSNTEEYIEKIIDTHNGENEFVDKKMMPEYDNTYVSMSVDNIDEFYDRMMEDIETSMDELENNPEFNLYADSFDEEFEDSDEVMNYPTPHTVKFSYSTDNEDTLTTRTEITFNTLEAASKFNRDLDESDDDITVDVTLDETTVIIEQETTSDVVIEEINTVFDSLLTGTNPDNEPQEPQNPDNEPQEPSQNSDAEVEFEQVDNTVEINVIQLNEDEYVDVTVFFEDDYSIINEDNETEWADADTEGQTIIVENVSAGSSISVTASESEFDYGTSVDSYTVER